MERRPIDPPPRGWRWLGWAVAAIHGTLGVGLSLCYGFRPDWAMAVTVLPVWIWLLPAVGLTLLCGLLLRWRYLPLFAAFWLAYLFAFADEPFPLLRSMWQEWPAPQWQAAHEAGNEHAIRVVSLNCRGLSRAAKEVEPYHPDVVLLQESPGRREVQRLAETLFGKERAVAWGPDGSIIARGTVVASGLAEELRRDASRATIRLPSGARLRILSLRLPPPVVRVDLWSPRCWIAQYRDRRERRRALDELLEEVRPFVSDVPLIVAGDFNAPAGDGVFDLLRPALRDTFREDGLGWGNTITNAVPFHRIDQVWASPHFRIAAVVARPTKRSDHRMVICDLILPAESQRRTAIDGR